MSGETNKKNAYIQGLRSAAELNGRIATMLRFETSAGRYVVDLRRACAQPAQPNSVQSQPAAKHPLYMGREETLRKSSGLG